MGLLHRRTIAGRLLPPVGHARVLQRRTTLGRLTRSITDSDVPATVKSTLTNARPSSKVVRSGLAAVGSAIGLTAGSAAVSARRRRSRSTS